MGLFSLEQSRAAYRADFICYGLLVTALAVAVAVEAPAGRLPEAAAWALAGSAGWTLAEYLLHRLVLHGLQPFRGWHAQHHARPQALIATPTVLTVAAFALLVFAPAMWFAPAWRACALTLGVLAGYLGYTVAHHAVHQLHGQGRWLRRHKRWHALHHRPGAQACYGVSSGVWDRVFGSAGPRPGDWSRQR